MFEWLKGAPSESAAADEHQSNLPPRAELRAVGFRQTVLVIAESGMPPWTVSALRHLVLHQRIGVPVDDPPAAALAPCRMGDAQMGDGPYPCTGATVRDVLDADHQREVSSHNRCEDIVALMRPAPIHARDLRQAAPNGGPAAFVAAQRAEKRHIVRMIPPKKASSASPLQRQVQWSLSMHVSVILLGPEEL